MCGAFRCNCPTAPGWWRERWRGRGRMIMKTETKATGSSGYLLPIVAAACALLSLILLAASGFGTKWGIWHFRTGFSILKYSAYLGLVSVLLGLAAGAVSLKGRRPAGILLS